MYKLLIKLIRTCSSFNGFIFLFGLISLTAQTEYDKEENITNWKGFERKHFEFKGRDAWLTIPSKALPSKPWVWRARFPEFHSEADSILVSEGFHIAYINTNGMLGNPASMDIWDKFYDHLISMFKLDSKVALSGVSRGGLFIYSWAKRNPKKVHCIYGDAPVCDFKSWPGGFGQGKGSKETWDHLKVQYGFRSDAEALAYRDNPLENLEILAAEKVPILHMIGLKDEIVPADENSFILADRYTRLGGMATIVPCTEGKQDLFGHHYPIETPRLVADFIKYHSGIQYLGFPLSMSPKISQSTNFQIDKNQKRFKVITYNIWNGYDWGKDSLRRKAVQNWINDQSPDVVALQELCNYTPKKLLEDARNWGHNYAVLLKTSGYSVGITSSKPIEVKDKIMDGMHHGALHCKTFGIDFLVIHLHPGSIKRRREETQILISKLDEIKKQTTRHMVLGDFNGHSPHDEYLYDPNGYLISRLKESNAGKGLDGNLDGNTLDYAVLSYFLSIPLYDPVVSFSKDMAERGSFPGRILTSKNKETEEELKARLERIDYILVSSKLRDQCISAKVCNGEENWYLSDHYPVLVEFNIANSSLNE